MERGNGEGVSSTPTIGITNGARLGKTNQALRTVALANTPYVNEQ